MSVGGLYHSRQLTVIAAEKNWTKTKTIYSLIELMLTGKREDLRSRLQDICVFENDWLCVDIFIRKWLVATPSLCGYNSTATDIDFLVHQHDTSPDWEPHQRSTLNLPWLCVCPGPVSLGLSARYLLHRQIISSLAPDLCPRPSVISAEKPLWF